MNLYFDFYIFLQKKVLIQLIYILIHVYINGRMICLLLYMILSHRIFLAVMCENHALKKVLINLLFSRMNILLMKLSILFLIISLETLKINLFIKIKKKSYFNKITTHLNKTTQFNNYSAFFLSFLAHIRL
jgi:hypothetical protein